MTHRILILAFAASLSAQQIVTTFAGTEWVFPGGGRPALDTPLGSNLSAAVDPQCRLVFADSLNHVVARIEPSGTVTVLVGNGLRADSSNYRIRRINSAGFISTIAGTTLDRLHQAMILFAAGRGEALRHVLVNDGAGKDQRFWRLAQALCALYPPGTGERRWPEGVLARKKGLGFI